MSYLAEEAAYFSAFDEGKCAGRELERAEWLAEIEGLMEEWDDAVTWILEELKTKMAEKAG